MIGMGKRVQSFSKWKGGSYVHLSSVGHGMQCTFWNLLETEGHLMSQPGVSNL